MFHSLRNHTALALLVVALCTCLSDLESVRHERHSCAAIAVCSQFFQLAAGVMLACEGYANFRAVIEGTVSGKYGSYVCFAWGEHADRVALNDIEVDGTRYASQFFFCRLNVHLIFVGSILPFHMVWYNTMQW